MSETVFILGAGASKEAGPPLMAEFIDVAERVWKEIRDIDPRDRHFAPFFQAIGELQTVHSKARLDIKNIESVFAAFEMAQGLGRLGSYTQAQLDELLISTRHVIGATLDWTTRFDEYTGSPTLITPPSPYARFAHIVEMLEGGQGYSQFRHRRQKVTVITLNYDLGLDFGLGFEGSIHYALPGEESDTGTPVLKLHGSLNWGRCKGCGGIIALPLEQDTVAPHIQFSSWHETHFISAKMMAEAEHCPGAPLEYPLLIPPTWNKVQHRQEFASVWARAAKALSMAQRIVVIGYSLPPSDVFIRYLYVIGAVSTIHLRRFLVVNPDQTGVVESRYRSLLGPSAEQCFEYRAQTFSAAMDALAEEFSDDRF